MAEVGTDVNNNNAVSFQICGAGIKAFSNRKPDGAFCQAKNISTGLLVPELTTDVEDGLLGI